MYVTDCACRVEVLDFPGAETTGGYEPPDMVLGLKLKSFPVIDYLLIE